MTENIDYSNKQQNVRRRNEFDGFEYYRDKDYLVDHERHQILLVFRCGRSNDGRSCSSLCIRRRAKLAKVHKSVVCVQPSSLPALIDLHSSSVPWTPTFIQAFRQTFLFRRGCKEIIAHTELITCASFSMGSININIVKDVLASKKAWWYLWLFWRRTRNAYCTVTLRNAPIETAPHCTWGRKRYTPYPNSSPCKYILWLAFVGYLSKLILRSQMYSRLSVIQESRPWTHQGQRSTKCQ